MTASTAPDTVRQGAASDRAIGARESLRIVQIGPYDAGLVAYRLHTAINVTTPHVSVMAFPAAHNPFAGPSQFRLPADAPMVTLAAEAADAIHCHLRYGELRTLNVRPTAHLVIHHHGTMYRRMAGWYNVTDAHMAALRIVSNLELLQYGERLHWLPNPVPVARYRRLRRMVLAARAADGGADRRVRVAHSPSRRERKGTDAFLRVCDRLRSRGVPIEPVLIERQPHAEALRMKASCDLCFDSFDLGIQCSGVEAAAMGLPVVAGDAHVVAEYERLLGAAPYTVALDEDALEGVLATLVTDADYRETETRRVVEYVETYHDEAAVALAYLDLLDAAFHWRSRFRLGARAVGGVVTPMPEPVETPDVVIVETLTAEPVTTQEPAVPETREAETEAAPTPPPRKRNGRAANKRNKGRRGKRTQTRKATDGADE